MQQLGASSKLRAEKKNARVGFYKTQGHPQKMLHFPSPSLLESGVRQMQTAHWQIGDYNS